MAYDKSGRNSKDIEIYKTVLHGLIERGFEIEKIQKVLGSDDGFHKFFYKPAVSATSKFIYNSLMKNVKRNLALSRLENCEYDGRRNFLWMEPFELLETYIYISQEIGDEFNQEFRPDAAKNNDLVFEVLIRLHGRACKTAFEMFVLMQKGFPEGALARWRTLHEIVVISFFIQKHGQNSAERYLLHDAVESCLSIKNYTNHPEIYQKHKNVLSDTLPSMREMMKIQQIAAKLCKKFGTGYKYDYGWAADIIPKPTFSKIEAHLNLDHLNPYYKMANISIHGGVKGINFFLSAPNSDFIPAGPGNMGMELPGQLAAISLLQLNTNLLTTKPCIKGFADITTLQKLEKKIKRSFVKVHKESMKIHRKLQRNVHKK